MEAVDDDVYQSIQRKTSLRRKHSMHKGFVLGHSTQAVQKDVGQDFAINSIHGIFIGSVSHQTPITYYLERLQNSSGCVARNVEGRQGGKIVFSGIASLTKKSKQLDAAEKPNNSRRKMSNVPTPESLTNLETAFVQSKSNDQAVHMPKEFEKALERLTNLFAENDVEFRAIDQQCWLGPENEKELARFWVRCRSKFDSDSNQAALSFLSGLCSEATPGQNKASALSQQTIWFNQVDFQPNEWIYCELSALQQRQCGGNFLMGKFWNRSGEILASSVQEINLTARAKF
ncbi:Acyl-CoA thioesterase II [Aphelenchoides bicaudatus]|nr:Acyl-CoA thioesterase II [Aphelenchoides bicaudatus]